MPIYQLIIMAIGGIITGMIIMHWVNESGSPKIKLTKREILNLEGPCKCKHKRHCIGPTQEFTVIRLRMNIECPYYELIENGIY